MKFIKILAVLVQIHSQNSMLITVRFKLSPFTEGYNDLVYGFTKHDVHAMEGMVAYFIVKDLFIQVKELRY